MPIWLQMQLARLLAQGSGEGAVIAREVRERLAGAEVVARDMQSRPAEAMAGLHKLAELLADSDDPAVEQFVPAPGQRIDEMAYLIERLDKALVPVLPLLDQGSGGEA